MRAGVKGGDVASKAARRNEIIDSCKTEEGHQHYMTNTFNSWMATDKAGKANVDVAPLEQTVNKVSEEGMRLSQIQGVLWPKEIWGSWYNKVLHPDQTTVIKGVLGTVQPEVPGEILPPGVYRMTNEITDKVQKLDQLENSKRSESNLFDGQIEDTYHNLAGLARSVMGQVKLMPNSFLPTPGCKGYILTGFGVLCNPVR